MNLQSPARSWPSPSNTVDFIVAAPINRIRFSQRIVCHLLTFLEAIIAGIFAGWLLNAPRFGHNDISHAVSSSAAIGAIVLLVYFLSGAASYDRFSSRLSAFAAATFGGGALTAAALLSGGHLIAALAAGALLMGTILVAKVATTALRNWLRDRGNLTRLVAVAADDPMQRASLIRLLSQRDDMQLVFAGSPSQLEILDELTRASQLDEIVLSGHQADEENIPALAGLAVTLVRVTPQDRIDLNVFDPVWGKKRVFGPWSAPASVITRPPLRGWRGVAKRIVDIAGSSIAILLLAPLLIACAIAVKLDSRGPVFFVQERAGYRNRPFRMFKFRSMSVEKADANGSQLTLRNDPRVTKVGLILRRTSMDELPQLFNVLKGDMSLVGPRPHPKGAKAGTVLYDDLIPNFYSRYRMKPGITGLAQISGLRGNTETEQHLIDRFQRDMEYAAEWTPLLDLAILLRTVSHLAKGTNAF